MTDKQIAETWNAWRDVVAMEHPPAEGELADGLQAPIPSPAP